MGGVPPISTGGGISAAKQAGEISRNAIPRSHLIIPPTLIKSRRVLRRKDNLRLPAEGSLRQIKMRRPGNGVYCYRIDGERVSPPGIQPVEVNRNRGRRNR